MEKMDVDEAVVDLSVSSSNVVRIIPPPSISIEPTQPLLSNNLLHPRRVLRPRTDHRPSYVESPDVLIVNGSAESRPRTNGNSAGHDYGSDSSDCLEMPPLAPIKELSPSELRQRDRGLRRLREDLRAEEMKLVLLKKLKQSQQLKENVAIPPSVPQSALPPTGLPQGLIITPTTVKVPTNKGQPPQAAHARHSAPHKPNTVTPQTMMRGQPPPARSSLHGAPISGSPIGNRGVNLSVPQPQRSSMSRSGFPPGVKDLPPSVTITAAPPQTTKTGSLEGKGIVANALAQPPTIPDQDRSSREDNQTPAQRQAAAKLALRKQLEKTLLQIPPPKPPPPEMHFIPNPSNTEFIYLVGLEHVVDFLTKETKPQTPITPFNCSQCQSDFTPVWKWESVKGKIKEHKVICEQCVTSNVKKALKAEHTNRLKTAFVKALQQEQEIEQRLAQNGGFTSNSPAPSPVTPEVAPKPATPTSTPRHAATPPAPPTAQPTPPPARSSHSSSKDNVNFTAATMQALQRQMMQTLSAGGPPANMFHLSPLFYPYQLAIAQAASSGKGTPNLADIQRAADMQRQYLLDMIPPQGGAQRHNWKT
ncbi:PREDICTED: transcriptional repressor p66-beta isoform X2 [Nicrophorus vespilloides]|uniref:Transcriptional repressor p66-beta isoform X2 n=1 Tax=Nicrophorus vespilloides TaxID=110193 RepID=A0ABM1MMR2_NICVS|nr:PREDICTED: transcriptional repressor p66-beta isoform X2 [Nicrophorus vespilloides]